MSFAELMNDNIEVLKKDGTRVPGLKASVQRNKVFLDAKGLLVELEDLILRKMSNGAEETYRVLDPGFHEAFHGIPAHYQMEVQKLGIPEAKRAIQNITINISGPNARFNHQSIDNSTNVVQIDSGAIEILESIRQEVAKLKLPAQESNAAHEVLEAVEEQFKLGSPKRTVVSALLAALPHVATIAKLIKALIDRC